MEDLIEEIIFNYNNGVEGLCIDPRDVSPRQNKMICSIENTISQSIGERISLLDNRRSGRRSRVPNSDDIEESMYNLMCGCRLSAKVIFTMLYLGISMPNKRFYKQYKQFFENNNHANNIISRGVNRPEDIKMFVLNDLRQYSPLYGKLVIGQILKKSRDTGINFSPYHTFVIVINDNGSCNVLSSWFDGLSGAGGKEHLVTNKVKSFKELEEILTIESLLDEKVCSDLFGSGNKLILTGSETKSNYEILFITQKQIENDSTKEKRSRSSSGRKRSSRDKKRKRSSSRKSSGRKSSGRKNGGGRLKKTKKKKR